MATRTVVPYRYAIYPNPYSKTKKSIEQKKTRTGRSPHE